MPTQGTEPLAKEDTLFLGTTDGGADLEDDLSQYGVNWTVAGATACIYSADDADFSPLTLPRAVELTPQIDSTPGDRTLYAMGGSPSLDTGSHGITTSSTGGGQLGVWIDSALEQTISLPGVSATLDDYAIVWTTMANPDTTGASDIQLSEVQVWNTSTGEFDKATWTHAAIPDPGTDRVFIAGHDTSGNGEYNEAIRNVRIGSGRFHTTVEGGRDWASQGSAQSLTLDAAIEQWVPPASVGMGNDGRAVGPTAYMCSRAVRNNKLRLVGPALNINYEGRGWIDSGWGSITGDLRLTWEGTTLLRPYLHHAPVPNGVNRCIPRVFIQQDRDITSSDTGDDETVVTVFCAERRPTSTADNDFLFYQSSRTVGTDHGNGATSGAWLDFGEMRLARNDESDVVFMIGLSLNGTAVDQQVRIKAFNVDYGSDLATDEVPIGFG